MAKHRILRSVAHNWAHSFLSDCNFIEDTIMVQLLRETARSCNEPTIVIDPLAKTLKPNQCNNPSLAKGIVREEAHLKSILRGFGCSLDMVNELELKITFDLQYEAPKYNEIRPGVRYAAPIRMPVAPKYSAQVHLIDNENRAYDVFIHEFWRY